MDNQSRYDTLERIAQKEIPDDMNIWHQIESQLPPPHRQRPTPFPLGKVAAIFVALFLVGSVSAYAFLQNQFQPDPGLEGVQTAALVTELDQQQTIDGKTVTLDWAFADSRRIAVHFTVTGLGDEAWWPQVDAATDSRGLVFPLAAGQPVASSGDISWVQSFSLYAPPLDSPEGSIADDTRHIEEQYGGTLPESLSLDLALYLERGDDSTTRTEPYRFSFDVPLTNGLLLDVAESQTVNGQTITLNRLIVTPSQTAAYLCYTHPAGNWHIRPTLQITGEPVDWHGIRGTEASSENESCVETEFNAHYDGAADTLTITVPALVSTDDLSYWQALPEAAAAEGIEVTVHDNHYELIAYPDDMTAETAAERVQGILAELRGDIAGPWVFDIALD